MAGSGGLAGRCSEGFAVEAWRRIEGGEGFIIRNA